MLFESARNYYRKIERSSTTIATAVGLPGSTQISGSRADSEKIARLCVLGFERSLASSITVEPTSSSSTGSTHLLQLLEV